MTKDLPTFESEQTAASERGAQRRYRVLVLADSCNPDWPSLPVVGYKFVRALAEHADVTLVTQIRNKPSIERDGIGKATVRYVDSERVAAPLHRFASLIRGHQDKGWTIQMAMDYPAYLYFEHLAFSAERSAIQTGAYDLIHRVTPMTPAIPSPIARKSPVPFVLGPLNGNLPWPEFYSAERHREKEWLSRFRSAYKLLPYRMSTLRRSSAILAAFDHTVRDIAPQFLDKVINFPEVGIDPDLFRLAPRQPSERVTVLFAGRLVPYKLPEAVVRAFAASPILRKHRLVVVGDGPEREKLESLSEQHALGNCVEILGRRKQSEVGELMQRSHIFAFPSIRELGAGVVVEAMACGMACVAVDYGGPATLLADGRGVLVPVGPLDSIVENFKTALESLVSDQGRIKALGARAHSHALDYYSWDRKARKTVEIYDWVTKQRSTIPSFW
jgi:glycosyltransferase involved in cell wall biosynthesis